MKPKDYYAVLGLKRNATADQIKRAYRKLARQYHPDVSKETDAEERFKVLAEAHEVLGDVGKRAAYDDAYSRPSGRPNFSEPPRWKNGQNVGGGNNFDSATFFDELFRRQASGEKGPRSGETFGGDQHAKATIELLDAYRGGLRTLSLSVPQTNAQGVVTLRERVLEVKIPKGIRAGQHLRLVGQGAIGHDGGAAGDLYLEIEFAPHPHFRVDGRDIYVNVPIAPWEAALGASIPVPTPDGSVQLSVPAGSAGGSKLRLKGRGIPSHTAGDLYVLLSIALPLADSETSKDAYRQFAESFASFQPRLTLET